MMHTLIIGGGAAGMAAAIAAARAGQAVTVLERSRRPLKKLGVTGNGRGNLLNAGAPTIPAERTLPRRCSPPCPMSGWRRSGRNSAYPFAWRRGGGCIPRRCWPRRRWMRLGLAARRLGVEIIVNARVTDLLSLPAGGFEARGTVCRYLPDVSKKSGKTRPGALAQETAACWRGDRVIVAAGGAAAPAHGTDGSAYALLTAFGHELVPPRPALCALLADPEPLHALAGQRARASLRLLDGQGACLAQSRARPCLPRMASAALPPCSWHAGGGRAVPCIWTCVKPCWARARRRPTARRPLQKRNACCAPARRAGRTASLAIC